MRLLSLLFPSVCPLCGRRNPCAKQPICSDCLDAQARLSYNPRGSGTIERLFWKRGFTIERAASMYRYNEGHVRALVHAIKYHRRPELAIFVARLWAEEMLQTNFFDGIDTIVPMPLHPLRQLRRGYNQSLYIARGLSQATGLPIVSGAVVRRGKATTQTLVHSHAERKANVEHAFRLKRPGRVEGKHVLLVDDVLTTGVTLTACARALAQAPGVRISIFALAYAGPILHFAEDMQVKDAQAPTVGLPF